MLNYTVNIGIRRLEQHNAYYKCLQFRLKWANVSRAI